MIDNSRSELMSKNLRSIKASPLGKLSRAGVKKAVSAVHVFPSSRGERWEVKEIGLIGLHRTFSSKSSALAFAKDFAVKKRSGVLVHNKHPRLKVNDRNTDAVYEIVFD